MRVAATVGIALALSYGPRSAQGQTIYQGGRPAPSTHVPAGGDTLPVIEVHRLAAGVYAAKINFVWSGWVELSNGILVIDPGPNERAARALADTIRARSGKRPVRYVVNTHGHTDHMAGDRWFAARGAAIVVHPNAVADIEHAYATELASTTGADSAARFTPRWIRVERRAAFGKAPRIVEVLSLGRPAHTAGDLVVYLPRQRVLFTGDIVTNRSIPWMLDPDMDVSGWQASIDSLCAKRFAADSLVPGHGQIAPPTAGVVYTRAYLTSLVEKATREASYRTSMAEIREWGDLGQFQGEEFYDEVHFINLRRLYNQALGRKTPGRSRPGAAVKY